MTPSEAEPPAPPNHPQDYDGTMLIQIYRALPKGEENPGPVRVCPVPKTFRSTDSEAFTPHFIGLGLYHHFHPNLPMNDKLKLGVAKRFLDKFKPSVAQRRFIVTDTGHAYQKLPDISDAFQSLQNQNVISQVEAFYHNTCQCDSRALPHVLTVDALFLLALLHSLTDSSWRSSDYYILTGKTYPVPPVNAADIELNMDGIVRDVFMFENQIPVFVIKHIVQALNLVPGSGFDFIDSIMLQFCKAHSPFAISYETISEYPEERDHLLHIMYYSVAPEQGSDDVQSIGLVHKTVGVVITVPALLIYLFLFGLWILLWILAYLVVVTLQPILKVIRFVLVKVIPWSSVIFGQPNLQFPPLRDFVATVGDLWNYYVLNDPFFYFSVLSFQCLVHFLSRSNPDTLVLVGFFYRQRIDELRRDSIGSAATVPSAAKLNEFRIRFKDAESDISSVKFDDMKGEFRLPCIKLDDTSQVILRNLVAYESSIQTTRLNLRSYVQLMRAIVQTHEDVKFLVEKKIIQTQLSAEAVIGIFNMPMGHSAGRLVSEEIEDLEVRLKNVKPKVDAINNLYLILTEFLRVCAVCAVVVAFYPLLAEGFHKLWCSTIFANSSQSYCGGNQVGHSDGNNYYHIISST